MTTNSFCSLPTDEICGVQAEDNLNGIFPVIHAILQDEQAKKQNIHPTFYLHLPPKPLISGRKAFMSLLTVLWLTDKRIYQIHAGEGTEGKQLFCK